MHHNDTALIEALGSSQRLGFLGDLPVPAVIAHARHFVSAINSWSATPTPRIADIGSGGGVPGLVVAVDLPASTVTLIDRRSARTDHLARLVRRLDLSARVEVLNEDLSKIPPALDGAFDAVTARGFGPPAATLAAGRPLLLPGGILVISEPPAGADDRWSPDLLQAHDLERCSDPGLEMAVLRAI